MFGLRTRGELRQARWAVSSSVMASVELESPRESFEERGAKSISWLLVGVMEMLSM